MKRLLIAAATAATVATTGISGALAADPEAFVEYRKNALHAAGGHMKAIAVALKSGVEAPKTIAGHAEGLAFLMSTLPNAFPEGTAGIAETKALDKVWEQKDKFNGGWEKSAEAANAVVEAANGGDMSAIGAAVKELGGTCKGCHDTFRKE